MASIPAVAPRSVERLSIQDSSLLRGLVRSAEKNPKLHLSNPARTLLGLVCDRTLEYGKIEEELRPAFFLRTGSPNLFIPPMFTDKFQLSRARTELERRGYLLRRKDVREVTRLDKSTATVKRPMYAINPIQILEDLLPLLVQAPRDDRVVTAREACFKVLVLLRQAGYNIKTEPRQEQISMEQQERSLDGIMSSVRKIDQKHLQKQTQKHRERGVKSAPAVKEFVTALVQEHHGGAVELVSSGNSNEVNVVRGMVKRAAREGWDLTKFLEDVVRLWPQLCIVCLRADGSKPGFLGDKITLFEIAYYDQMLMKWMDQAEALTQRKNKVVYLNLGDRHEW